MRMITSRRIVLERPRIFVLALLFLSGGLAACESVGETIGISSNLPDEYAVSVGPNLAVPPDIELRPPATGELPVTNDAASIVFGSVETADTVQAATTTPTNLSAGEFALLEEANAVTTNVTIRTVLGDAPAGSGVSEPTQPVSTVEPVAATASVPVPEPAAPIYDPKTDAVIDDFFDELMFWEGAERDKAIADDAIIDPAAEAARLEQNAAAGKPATEGATPMLLDGEPAVVETGP